MPQKLVHGQQEKNAREHQSKYYGEDARGTQSKDKRARMQEKNT